MPTVPKSTKTSLAQRLTARARTAWPQFSGLDVRYRGQFAYVNGELPDGESTKLMRLRYGGSARPRSALVNVTSAIFATGMLCADNSTICARRQVTTDPVPLRMIRSSRLPSSSSISRTRTRSATPAQLAGRARRRGIRTARHLTTAQGSLMRR
ncbi:hypothetical protein [Nonomuraea sp. NPDC002799]